MMWWQDFLWGVWNGWSSFILLVLHLFGIWNEYPVYDTAKDGGWYVFGFIFGCRVAAVVEKMVPNVTKR